jgi:hypothetical protein
MGRSFIEFKGCGFWTRDSVLEDWLLAAIAEMDRLGLDHQWKRDMSQRWKEVVLAGFTGGMNPKLDCFLTSPDRTEYVVDLSRRIIELSPDSNIKHLGELFISLLEGRLKPDAAEWIR